MKKIFILLLVFQANYCVLAQDDDYDIYIFEKLGLENCRWISGFDSVLINPYLAPSEIANIKKRYCLEGLKKEQIVYFENTNIIKSRNTKNGDIIRHEQFFENEKIRFDAMLKQVFSCDTIVMNYDEIIYKKYLVPILNGEFIEYNQNGTIKQKGTYINDRKVNEWVFNNEKGNPVEIINYDNFHYKSGPYSSFYSNGKKAMEGNYKVKILIEKTKCFDINTSIEIDCNREIKKSVKVGKWIYYNEDGSIKEEVDY